MKPNTTPYISDRIKNTECEIFFQNIMNQFANELGLICNMMYEGKESDMFSLIERSYIGVLNNAIIRAYPNDATTLQEFSVWKKGHNIGRADLLCNVKLKDQPVYFLFEGKQREFDGREYTNEKVKAFYRDFENQARKYYEAEIDDYKSKVFLIPIIFEWIRTQEKLDKVLSWDKENKDDGHTDFYILLKSNCDKDNSGLMVYGKVVDTTISDLAAK